VNLDIVKQMISDDSCEVLIAEVPLGRSIVPDGTLLSCCVYSLGHSAASGGDGKHKPGAIRMLAVNVDFLGLCIGQRMLSKVEKDMISKNCDFNCLCIVSSRKSMWKVRCSLKCSSFVKLLCNLFVSSLTACPFSFPFPFLSFLLAFLFACFAVQWAERRGYSKSSSVPFPIDAVPFRVNDDRKKDLELFVYEKRLRKGGNPNPNPNPNPKSQLQPKLQLSSQSPLPPPPPDQEQPGAENPERTKPKPETGREGFDIFVKAEAALRGINVTD